MSHMKIGGKPPSAASASTTAANSKSADEGKQIKFSEMMQMLFEAKKPRVVFGSAWNKGVEVIVYEGPKEEATYEIRIGHAPDTSGHETSYIRARAKNHAVVARIEFLNVEMQKISSEIVELNTVAIQKSKHFQETLKIFQGMHEKYQLKPPTK